MEGFDGDGDWFTARDVGGRHEYSSGYEAHEDDRHGGARRGMGRWEDHLADFHMHPSTMEQASAIRRAQQKEPLRPITNAALLPENHRTQSKMAMTHMQEFMERNLKPQRPTTPRPEWRGPAAADENRPMWKQLDDWHKDRPGATPQTRSAPREPRSPRTPKTTGHVNPGKGTAPRGRSQTRSPHGTRGSSRGAAHGTRDGYPRPPPHGALLVDAGQQTCPPEPYSAPPRVSFSFEHDPAPQPPPSVVKTLDLDAQIYHPSDSGPPPPAAAPQPPPSAPSSHAVPTAPPSRSAILAHPQQYQHTPYQSHAGEAASPRDDSPMQAAPLHVLGAPPGVGHSSVGEAPWSRQIEHGGNSDPGPNAAPEAPSSVDAPTPLSSTVSSTAAALFDPSRMKIAGSKRSSAPPASTPRGLDDPTSHAQLSHTPSGAFPSQPPTSSHPPAPADSSAPSTSHTYPSQQPSHAYPSKPPDAFPTKDPAVSDGYPSKPFEAPDSYPSKPTSMSDGYPSKPYDDGNPSKPMPVSEGYPSKPFEAPGSYPSKPAPVPDGYPSKADASVVTGIPQQVTSDKPSSARPSNPYRGAGSYFTQGGSESLEKVNVASLSSQPHSQAARPPTSASQSDAPPMSASQNISVPLKHVHSMQDLAQPVAGTMQTASSSQEVSGSHGDGARPSASGPSSASGRTLQEPSRDPSDMAMHSSSSQAPSGPPDPSIPITQVASVPATFGRPSTHATTASVPHTHVLSVPHTLTATQSKQGIASVPRTQAASVPATLSAARTGTQQALSVPPTMTASAPATHVLSMPHMANASVPATQTLSQPQTASASVPTTQVMSVPMTMTGSVPASQAFSVPQTINASVPATQAPSFAPTTFASGRPSNLPSGIDTPPPTRVMSFPTPIPQHRSAWAAHEGRTTTLPVAMQSQVSAQLSEPPAHDRSASPTSRPADDAGGVLLSAQGGTQRRSTRLLSDGIIMPAAPQPSRATVSRGYSHLTSDLASVPPAQPEVLGSYVGQRRASANQSGHMHPGHEGSTASHPGAPPHLNATHPQSSTQLVPGASLASQQGPSVPTTHSAATRRQASDALGGSQAGGKLEVLGGYVGRQDRSAASAGLGPDGQRSFVAAGPPSKASFAPTPAAVASVAASLSKKHSQAQAEQRAAPHDDPPATVPLPAARTSSASVASQLSGNFRLAGRR